MSPMEKPGRNEGRKTDFSPIQAARRVLRLAATGSLASLGEAGNPFASLVTVATSHEGEPVLLLSRLAVHTRNLEKDRRASLLLVAPGGEGGDPLAGARVTLTGTAAPDPEPRLRRRFLARHSEAIAYADFPDFAIYRFSLESAHLVAGFGRIVDLAAADLLTDCGDCRALIDSETGAVDHMNEDHSDALGLYASELCGMPRGAWVATGCDPDGLDLRAGDLRARLDFPQKVRNGGELRAVLVDRARAARSTAA